MQVPNDVQEFLNKFGGAVITALLAIGGKVSNEILMRRKMSWINWIALIGVSLFWAWMAGLFCAYMEYKYLGTSIIVGLATMLGEKINIYLAQNYKNIIERFLLMFITKK
jgi:hypothetical protein